MKWPMKLQSGSLYVEGEQVYFTCTAQSAIMKFIIHTDQL